MSTSSFDTVLILRPVILLVARRLVPSTSSWMIFARSDRLSLFMLNRMLEGRDNSLSRCLRVPREGGLFGPLPPRSSSLASNLRAALGTEVRGSALPADDPALPSELDRC